MLHSAFTRREESEKRLLERVELFEKNVHDVFTQLQVYVRKLAKTRDQADILAKMLLKLGEGEMISKSFRNGMIGFACHFSSVQDYRNAEIERLEKKVISEMVCVGDVCKTIRESVRKMFSNTNSKSDSLTDGKSFLTVLPQLHAVQVDRYEEKKIADLKVCVSHNLSQLLINISEQRLFLDMIRIEMLFHAKSLEMLTLAFASVNSVNESEDVSEFRRIFKLTGLLPVSAQQQHQQQDLQVEPGVRGGNQTEESGSTTATLQSSMSGSLSLTRFLNSSSSSSGISVKAVTEESNTAGATVAASKSDMRERRSGDDDDSSPDSDEDEVKGKNKRNK